MKRLLAMLCLLAGSARAEFSGAFEPEAVRAVARAALDRHRADNPKPRAHWRDAVYLIGWAEWTRVDLRDEDRAALYAVGRRLAWRPGPREWHADDQGILQFYLMLYERDRDPALLAPTRALFDRALNGERGAPLTWCDALFMTPPVLAHLSALTGDPRYLDFMVSEWQRAAELLYNRAHRLYHRDAQRSDRLEANGEPVFWLRGNGWVLAGLARVLPHIPADHPARALFVETFREMSARAAALQGADGLWRPGLLHPAGYEHAESSGSALLLYGLAWGVRSGLLDRAAFEPAIRRGWAGLVRCVYSDGLVGYVQPAAAGPRPRVRPRHTEPYGVGAFLLTASEVYGLAIDRDPKPAHEESTS